MFQINEIYPCLNFFLALLLKVACPSFCLAVSCRLFPHEFFHHQTFSYQALYVIIIIIIGMIITITSLIPGACKDENEESSLRIPHLQVLVQLQY